MKKISICTILSALIACFMVFSCKTDLENLSQIGIVPTSKTQARMVASENSDNSLILGKKLTNPYTVEVMQKAYLNLQKNTSNIPILRITPNHSYVRILPRNKEEYLIITEDDKLVLYDYPLDYEIVQNGNSYKDPSVGTNPYTWYYCVVPNTYKFASNLRVEVLEKLYLPKGNGNNVGGIVSKVTTTTGAAVNDNILDALENEALRLTGNRTPKGELTTAWVPSGTIKVWDDHLSYDFEKKTYINKAGYVPVVGCKVRTRRWFSTETAITNDKGYYYLNVNYSNPANYSIEWERDDFDIWDSIWGQAYFNGPKQAKGWDLNIEQGGTPKSWLFAHVHRAAYTYYYKNSQWGIKTPTRKKGMFPFLKERLHIGARQGSCKTNLLPNIFECRSHYFTFNSFIGMPTVVVIWDSSYQPSIDIFATTIHELAHASHWELGYSTGQFVLDALTKDPRLPESWAEVVEWKITNDIYPDRNHLGYYQTYMTKTRIKNNGGYTPIGIDMMDSYNQRLRGSDYPDDKVSGYTLAELEKALPGALGSWWNWRTRIYENNKTNPTRENLSTLFYEMYP